MLVNLYANRGAHGRVVDLIGRRIMLGELPPGAVLDPEDLMAEIDVSRTVIREALRALTAKGLVDARPRRGTFVTERSSWNLLDGDVMRWRTAERPDPTLVIQLGEVRQMIEPQAARKAAERRTPAQLEALTAAMQRLDEAHTASPDKHVQADIDFHRAVLEAAGNELLVQFEVILEPALLARDSLAFHQEDNRYLEQHRAVLDAIAAGDPDLAEAQMAKLMAAASADVERILHGGTHTQKTAQR